MCWLFQISVPQTTEEFEHVDGGYVLTRYRLCKFAVNEGKSTLTQIKGFQKVHMFLQLQGRDCVQIHFINLSDIPSVPTSRPEWRADVFEVHRHVLRLQTSFICLESKILYREGNWKRAGDQRDENSSMEEG